MKNVADERESELRPEYNLRSLRVRKAGPKRVGLSNSITTIPLLFSIQSDTISMYTVLRSKEFDHWLSNLKDAKGKARIIARIRSAEHGNLGDVQPVGAGVSEMRIHFGPGYRVYFTQRGKLLILLLIGGDKSSQKRDIKRARELADKFEGQTDG